MVENRPIAAFIGKADRALRKIGLGGTSGIDLDHRQKAPSYLLFAVARTAELKPTLLSSMNFKFNDSIGAFKRVKNGKPYLIPASEQTNGRLTTGNAKFYAPRLKELLQTEPQRAM